MSTPVPVWFVARHCLKGPAPALAIVTRSKNGASAWAQLVEILPPPPGAPRWHFPWSWYEAGHRYKIGTTVFLTELAAQRFLAGEIDRAVKTASDYQRNHFPERIHRASKMAHPDVYVDKHLTKQR